MSSVIDLEAQQVAQAALRAGQDINHEAQSVIPQVEGSGGSDISEINIDQSHRSDDVNDRPSQADSEAPIPAASNSTVDTSSRDTTSDPESDQQPEEQPEEPRMIGDFDGSANEFWKLYRDEAKSHDDARIDTLKEGMDSALIFAGLFSAALTAFVVDSKQNLTPRQHSTILSQISVQLSSIAPQVTIPSTPPPPFPPFSPLISDVRVNVFWFMALAFSLLAALLAILVQQWVRNYMHVFQRYAVRRSL
ncbi:hypothetical protein F5888DRAFT_1119222 [Russula emetica]|nr:hypothetical protein F5888DRAFT_1119222 [Russula emetica]